MTTFATRLPAVADLGEKYTRIDLDRLPVDPDGWCSFEISINGWQHTALCRQGVANGGPKLCEMWEQKDRLDAAKHRRESAWELAQIDAAEDRHPQLHNGGFDRELNTRRDGAWFGHDDSDRIYGRGSY